MVRDLASAPFDTPEQITMPGGIELTLRPICPDDASRLQAFHTRLSDESIFFRFLGHPRVLSDEQAHALSNVDFQNMVALIATMPTEDGVRLVGVARYELIPHTKPKRAEAAIIVEDKFQQLGLGSILSDRLVAYARKHGIQTCVAVIDPENFGVMRLLNRRGLVFKVVGRDAEAMEIHIDISGHP